MRKIVLLFFIFISVLSCHKKEKQKNTFIFDFDDTITHCDGCYIRNLFPIAEGNKGLKDQIHKEYAEQLKMKIPEQQILQNIILKYAKALPKEEYVNNYINALKNGITPSLKDVIKKLISDGNEVFIVGSGFYGCAFLPSVVKDFRIKKDHIYTGYFKSYSKDDVAKTRRERFMYVNCANPDDSTVDSYNKSDVIKLIKSQGKTPGKITHIGDGDNDLEVWKAGAVDNFIGFGIHKTRANVQKEAPVFVKTIEKFKTEIKKLS